MAFKQDEDFLRFITMGAGGCAECARHFSHEHGHRIVELERYAMANKLWETKIKRLRVPDLLCLDCGLRIEARTKSKLEIKVSDSEAVGREWDYGLRDADLIALIPWDSENGIPHRVVTSFSVSALRDSLAYSRLGPRKSVSEGSERDRTWTARVPKRAGRVLSFDAQEQKIKTELETGRRQSYRIEPPAPAYEYVSPGDTFPGGQRFLIGVVRGMSTADLNCPGKSWNPIGDLDSSDEVTRYIAVKACGYLENADLREHLEPIAYEDADDRIRLEAFASLARLDPKTYTPAITSTAIDRDPDNRTARAFAMEAIFILSELGTNEAEDALDELASERSLDQEARSAAVWGLGVTGADAPKRVLPYIADEEQQVALHALAGIGPLQDEELEVTRNLLEHAADGSAAASASMLLSEQGEAGARALLSLSMEDGLAGTWACAGLTKMPEDLVRKASPEGLDPSVEHVLAPAWASATSWLATFDSETPLQFLKRQTIRHQTSP